MKNVKVLGTGCRNCQVTYRLIEEVARAKGVEIALEKVEQINEIMRLGVLITPGVIVDGRIVHSGGVPDRKRVESWL
ncbi:MAG: thioredoxin family protein [Gammaproteobacteria bacterium]|jgi:small redox-active disulfide protein 2|nr:thioredoxin family protein [Gammaproteobacteria bacterium]